MGIDVRMLGSAHHELVRDVHVVPLGETGQSGRVVYHDVRGVGGGVPVGHPDPLGAHVGQVVYLGMGINGKGQDQGQGDGMNLYAKHKKPPFICKVE
jgi:hypothetical protein